MGKGRRVRPRANKADSDNLHAPEVIAQEMVEGLESALEQFRLIAGDLNEGPEEVG